MSRLNELIDRMCPHGVEFKYFFEKCKYIRGVTYNKAKEASKPGYDNIKVLRANNITLNSNILNFEDVKELSPEVMVKEAQWLRKGDILICAGSGSKEHIGKVAYVSEDMDYTFGGFMAVIRTEKELDSRFMFHILSGYSFRTHLEKRLEASTINNINKDVMKSFRIPVPPLEVQREIVQILDGYNNKNDSLMLKLMNELSNRKRQYEYYRTSLIENCKKVSEKCIPDIAYTYIGLVTTMTKHYVDNGVPLIHNSDIKENFFDFKKKTYLDFEFAEDNKKRRHKKGDVITVHTGDVGTSAIISDDLDGSLGFATIVSRINDVEMILPEWLCHCLNSNYCKRQIEQLIRGDRNNLNLKEFNKIVIPIPSIDEQRRIITLLDKMKDNYDEIIKSLLLEIEWRRKQYEYYRETLLLFEEKTA